MRGTRRLVDRHVVDPNEIKTLPTGRLVMITKTPVAAVTRVQVRPLEQREARPEGPPGGLVSPLVRQPAAEILPAREPPPPSRTQPSRAQPSVTRQPPARAPARQPPHRAPPDVGL
jgi:hypothetical protein